jgi:hypothetical protein
LFAAEEDIDRDRIALGIQQPWAELILRGIKTIEVRSQPTRQRGIVYLYASKRSSTLPAAAHAARRNGINVELLATGTLVGAVELTGCRPCRRADHRAACVNPELVLEQFAWELGSTRRFEPPIPVRFLPYGVWFYPFKRRQVRQ